MKKIPLTNGGFALVDDSDFKYLSRFTWHENKRNNGQGYVRRNCYNPSNQKTTHRYIHQDILGVGKGEKVDHRNRNTFDNQRRNLRRATTTQNLRNQRLRSNNTTGFKGVCFHKRARKFMASIRVNKSMIVLGLFKSKKSAAMAYDEAALNYFGEFALTNKMLGLL